MTSISQNSKNSPKYWASPTFNDSNSNEINSQCRNNYNSFAPSPTSNNLFFENSISHNNFHQNNNLSVSQKDIQFSRNKLRKQNYTEEQLEPNNWMIDMRKLK